MCCKRRRNQRSLVFASSVHATMQQGQRPATRQGRCPVCFRFTIKARIAARTSRCDRRGRAPGCDISAASTKAAANADQQSPSRAATTAPNASPAPTLSRVAASPRKAPTVTLPATSRGVSVAERAQDKSGKKRETRDVDERPGGFDHTAGNTPRRSQNDRRSGRITGPDRGDGRRRVGREAAELPYVKGVPEPRHEVVPVIDLVLRGDQERGRDRANHAERECGVTGGKVSAHAQRRVRRPGCAARARKAVSGHGICNAVVAVMAMVAATPIAPTSASAISPPPGGWDRFSCGSIDRCEPTSGPPEADVCGLSIRRDRE